MSGLRTIRGAAIAAAMAVGIGIPTPTAGAKDWQVGRLLPADTLFVVSVDDAQAYSEAQKDMPLRKILAENEVRAFLEKPRQRLQEAFKMIEERVRSEEGFEDFELSIDQLLSGHYGKMFLAVTHVALPDPQAGRPLPDIGLVIGLEAREGAPDWTSLLKDVVVRSFSRMGVETSFQPVQTPDGNYEEARVQVLPLLVARAGNLHLISLSPQSMRAVLARANGRETQDVLLHSPGFQSCLGQVRMLSPNALLAYFNGGLSMRTAVEGVKSLLAAEGEGDFVPVVDQLVRQSGLLGLGGILAASASENGVAHFRAFTQVQSPPAGLLAITPAQPLDLGMLKRVPKGATSVGMGMFDPVRLYDTVLEMVKSVDEDVYQQVKNSIDAFGMQLGGPGAPVDLRTDFLANLGPQFAVVSPQASNPMMPSMLFLASTRDGDKLMDTLQKLLQFGSMMSQGQFQVASKTYHDHAYLTVSVPPEVGMPFQPACAVVDGVFVVSLNLGDLKRFLRSSEKGQESILANEDFQRFFSKIPEGAPLVSLNYTDVKRTVENAYGALTMTLPMISMAADVELPLDLAMLPRQDTISRHLFGSLSYTVRTENGFLTEGHGPIGGEALAALAGAGVAAGVLFLGTARLEAVNEEPSAVAPPPAPVEETPGERVRFDLNELKTAITIYRLQFDRYPERLEQLLEPTDAYPKGCLGRDALPVDPWGHAYRYAQRDGGYRIWSVGPNGSDEQGGGDDIAIEKH